MTETTRSQVLAGPNGALNHPTGDPEAEPASMIERGVPMPKKHHSHIGGSRKYPWIEMEIGDSFPFPAGYVVNHAYNLARQASKTYAPRQFKTRRDNDGNMRCWRVA